MTCQHHSLWASHTCLIRNQTQAEAELERLYSSNILLSEEQGFLFLEQVMLNFHLVKQHYVFQLKIAVIK